MTGKFLDFENLFSFGAAKQCYNADVDLPTLDGAERPAKALELTK